MGSLRAPFVVTVAMLSGCSSSGESSPAAHEDVGDPSSDATNDDATIDDTARDAPRDGGIDAADAADTSEIANPAGCPASDPGFGPFHQACSIADTVRCTYRDECPQRPGDAGPAVNVYTCHDDGSGSHWTLVSPAYVPECPAVEPTKGSPCPCSPHMQYIACLYGSCEDFTSSYANCEGPEELEHAWRVTPTSCNPPEPDGGLDGGAHD